MVGNEKMSKCGYVRCKSTLITDKPLTGGNDGSSGSILTEWISKNSCTFLVVCGAVVGVVDVVDNGDDIDVCEVAWTSILNSSSLLDEIEAC